MVLMFRRLYEATTRLLTHRTPRTPLPDTDLGGEVRTPDPYVWRLPTPHDARWKRWHKRSRAAGRHLPFPLDEPCWQLPPEHQQPPWQAESDLVRPYVPTSHSRKTDIAHTPERVC
jgi:hypothetical protein